MRTVRVAIVGFGFVGQGVYNILQERREEYKAAYQMDVHVHKVLVNQLHKENRTLPTGFDPSLLTDTYTDIFPSFPQSAGAKNPNAIDYVFECSVGEEPAFSYLKAALEEGASVITANKVMFASHMTTLQTLAKEINDRLLQEGADRDKLVRVGFEATVAGGVPIIKMIQRMLPTQKVNKVEGILNGTTNFILSDMREHLSEKKSYESSLKEAQEKGYAEADPFNDVSGKDAFYKLMILSQLCFGKMPKWEEVEVVGIQDITSDAIAAAQDNGQQRYRHVASITKEGEVLKGKVTPQLVSPTHSLHGVEGSTNAIAVHCDYLNCITVLGPGAGSYPTGSAMVEDFLSMESLKRGY
uniref:Homoserine dehydrogenase n=1 Tax=Angomonas desouzai TaxID=59800 RepID=U5KMK8_9TRYP|nr:homoserine dehydrogenase [Angomonas desouzai]